MCLDHPWFFNYITLKHNLAITPSSRDGILHYSNEYPVLLQFTDQIKGLNQDYVKQRNNIPKNVTIELETAFQKNNYVYGNDKKTLSRQLNLKPIQLERWFYYRRKKRFSSVDTSALNINHSDSNPESFEVNLNTNEQVPSWHTAAYFSNWTLL